MLLTTLCEVGQILVETTIIYGNVLTIVDHKKKHAEDYDTKDVIQESVTKDHVERRGCFYSGQCERDCATACGNKPETYVIKHKHSLLSVACRLLISRFVFVFDLFFSFFVSSLLQFKQNAMNDMLQRRDYNNKLHVILQSKQQAKKKIAS